jgi:hypothetical protein
MQSGSPQEITWPVVALEALKYLGPAVLVLIGSLFTLRHQRLSRQKELDAGARMKARELVFNHYQKKLDKLSAASDDLGRSLGEIQTLMHAPDATDPVPVAAKFLNSFISISLMAKHEAEGIEAELEAFGLRQNYEQELADLNRLKAAPLCSPMAILSSKLKSCATYFSR